MKPEIHPIIDKILIVILISCLLWLATSKPVIVNQDQLISKINQAFEAQNKRIKAIEAKLTAKE